MDRFWLDHYFRVFGGRYRIGSLCAGALFFVGGLVMSWRIDFQRVYLRTFAIYLGVCGIAWVSGWLGWGSRKIPELISSIRPAFRMSDEEFEAIASKWMARFYCTRVHLLASALVSVIVFGFVGLRVFREDLPWFPHPWSLPPHVLAKMSVLGVFALAVVFLVMTTAVGIVVYCWFIMSVSKNPLVLSVEFARAKLRATADFGVRTALAWAVGISLFILLLAPALGPFSKLMIGLLVLLGVAIALVPQYALHQALERVKRDLLDRGWHAAGSRFTEDLFRSPESRGIYDLMKSIGDSKTWVYSATDFVTMVGTWLLPVFIVSIDRWPGRLMFYLQNLAP